MKPDVMKRLYANQEAKSTLIANQQDTISTLRYQVQGLLGVSHDGERDLYDIYGYPKSLGGDGGYQLMRNAVRRIPLANRLTLGMARSCWRGGVEIYESKEEDAEELTNDDISNMLKTKLLAALEKADGLNRIGRFACLYIGVPDGLDPWMPLGKVQGDKWDQVYFMPYAYDGIQISDQDKNPQSPRYGLPEMYTVQRQVTSESGSKDTQINALKVHWSRIVHLNEQGLESNVEGTGYLEPIFNQLLDIQKASGGASEAYLRNARRLIAMEVAPEFAQGMDAASIQSFKDRSKKFTNRQEDQLIATGAKIHQMQSTHASPLDTVKVALWQIAGYSLHPLRVLTGEGSGQLAGNEDRLAMNAIIQDRQNVFCRGAFERVLEIFTNAGMISLPDGYEVRFPLQQAVTEMQEVDMISKKAQAFNAVASGLSGIGGDQFDGKSVMKEVGLTGIEIDNSFDVDVVDE